MIVTMSRSEDNTENRYGFLILAALFLAVSNFMLLGVYILLLLSVLYFFRRRKMPFANSVLPLVLFSIAYFFTVLIHGESAVSAAKIFVCPLIWLMSYSAASNKDMGEIKRLFVTLSLGMAIHGVINFLYNSFLGTNLRAGLSYDFWSQAYSPSTGQAVNFTLLVAIAFWMIFLQKESKAITVIGIAVLAIASIYDVSIGGRTFLLLIAIAIGISLIMYITFSFTDKAFRRRTIPLLFGILFLIILGVILYQHDVFGIRSAYERSYLYIRLTYHNAGDLRSNDRIEKKLEYITNASKYLWGGNYLSTKEGFGYAHELWLDTYDDAGIVSYILIVIYTFISGSHFVKVGRSKNVDHRWRIAIITMLVIVMLQFFVEPILSGSPMLLYSYIIMDAALTRWLYDQSIVKE